MSSATKGWQSCESWTKKFVRWQVYRHIYMRLTGANFRRSRFLYLASGDGGDASLLRGMQVPPTQQLAVDHNPEALGAFSERFPDVPTFCGDLADASGDFDVVFADLYANVANTKIAECLRATSHRLTRRDGRFFVVAFMEGREEQQTMCDILAARAEIELAGGNGPEHRRDQQLLLNAMGRFMRVWTPIKAGLRERRIMSVPEFLWRYPGNRVPMVVAGISTSSCPRKWTDEKFDRRVERQDWARKLSWQTWRRLSKEDLVAYLHKREALELGTRVCADLFNIPPATLAAYNAHYASGTYTQTGAAS